jgi:hypothetical protein
MAFGWPAWPLAALGAGMMALSFGVYGGWLGRLKRLRDYVQECLCATYGRRLFEFAQRAAGSGDRPGVCQAIADLIRQEALPAVRRFEQARRDLIAQARQNLPFPPDEGTTELLADAGQAADLHALLREDLDDSALADDARDLLRAGDLYAGWRDPAPDQMLEQAASYERRQHLLPWEARQRTMGDFLRALFARHHGEETREAAFASWVDQRMDRLAHRAVPLALRPPCHPERDNPEEDARAQSRDGVPGALQTDVSVLVPASLGWRQAEEDASEDGCLPPGSAAADLAVWIGASTQNAVSHAEGDRLSCRVTLAGLTPERALAALGSGRLIGQDSAVSAPRPASGRAGEHVEGNGRSEPATTAEAELPEGSKKPPRNREVDRS